MLRMLIKTVMFTCLTASLPSSSFSGTPCTRGSNTEGGKSYRFLVPQACSRSYQKTILTQAKGRISFQLSLSSECRLASPGSPCTTLGTSDCKYELTTGERCCCGQCSAWASLACVPDQTSGAGVWQIFPICPAEGCGSEGE